jgi:hypothetical protein
MRASPAAMLEASRHGSAIDAWAARRLTGAAPPRQVAAFEEAFAALWRRARRTLGEVTLAAIVERALHASSLHHPALARVRLDGDRLRCEALLASGEATLAPALRRALDELLTLLGLLTGEILTPSLHAELARATRDGGSP